MTLFCSLPYFWYDTYHFICMIGPLLKWTYHQLSNVERPPGGHCWNTYLRWVEALRFICGSGTRIFHLRMSGPQMGSGVSPIIRMPQWWSRRWPPWDAPHRQKVALCILSLRVHAIPLRVAPMPAVRYDLNGGLPTCIRFIIYQEYMVIIYCYVFFVNLIWYLYLFWLNKHCLSLSESESCFQYFKRISSVLVVACNRHRTHVKPVWEPRIVQFISADINHQTSVSQ